MNRSSLIACIFALLLPSTVLSDICIQGKGGGIGITTPPRNYIDSCALGFAIAKTLGLDELNGRHDVLVGSGNAGDRRPPAPTVNYQIVSQLDQVEFDPMVANLAWEDADESSRVKLATTITPPLCDVAALTDFMELGGDVLVIFQINRVPSDGDYSAVPEGAIRGIGTSFFVHCDEVQ